MRYISISILLCMLLFACHNGSDNNTTTTHDAPKTHADSLLKDVMDGHDFAMAKMSKLSAAQKRVQHERDSINKLPQTQQKSNVVYKTGLDSLAEKLKYADFSMNKWMEEFDYDSATKSPNRERYLESENHKIANVKELISSALGKADSLFKRE